MLNEVGYPLAGQSRFFLSGKKLLVVLVLLVAMNASGQWVQKNNGMGSNNIVTSFAVCGSSLYITAGGKVFYTTTNGEYWDTRLISNYSHNSIIAKDNYAYVGKNGSGVYVSTDYGNMWNQKNSGLSNLYVNALIYNGNYVYAGTMGGVFSTTNNGENWGHQNSIDTRSFAKNGNNIFAGTWGNGVYSTTNYGAVWLQKGLADKTILSLAFSGNNLFAGTLGSGVYLSTDYGTTWTHTSFNYEDAYSLLAVGTNVISGGSSYPSSFSGICITTNNGQNWTKINEGFSYVPTIHSLYVYNNYVFAGTQGYSVWRRPLSEIVGIQNISTEVPLQFSLKQNYPNPFNPVTKIRFDVPNGFPIKTFGNDKVVLEVYDVMGREVQTLVNERLQPGKYETTFDGSSLNSGVYFYKLTIRNGGSSTEGFTETKKMMLIK